MTAPATGERQTPNARRQTPHDRYPKRNDSPGAFFCGRRERRLGGRERRRPELPTRLSRLAAFRRLFSRDVDERFRGLRAFQIGRAEAARIPVDASLRFARTGETLVNLVCQIRGAGDDLQPLRSGYPYRPSGGLRAPEVSGSQISRGDLCGRRQLVALDLLVIPFLWPCDHLDLRAPLDHCARSGPVCRRSHGDGNGQVPKADAMISLQEGIGGLSDLARNGRPERIKPSLKGRTQ
jgi:hypothetical protein